ncbi:MAG: SOS response-associated peptidase [Anaerolineales bacterium]
MCGRFTLTLSAEALQSAFPQFNFPAQHAPRYNIAPSQPVLALPNDGKLQAGFFAWGLIPGWAKDPAIGQKLINARVETLGEKPSFRGAYKYRRCLIFADGFYEWQAQPAARSKIPHFIHLKSGAPFALAGLWEAWQSPDGGEISTCAIITTTPNPLMAALHDRMPVILPPAAQQAWLSPAPRAPQELQQLLTPYPAEEMEAFPVAALVNSPANDRADLIRPLQP